MHSEACWEKCWLYSLTAAGRKDLWYLSFTHLGCVSLLLKELPSAVIVTCRGWDCWCGYVSSVNPLQCLPNGQSQAGESFSTNTREPDFKDHAGIFFFFLSQLQFHIHFEEFTILCLCATPYMQSSVYPSLCFQFSATACCFCKYLTFL